GPFVRITANGKEIGDSVDAGPIEIAVRVDAAEWVRVDKVELVINGDVAETWTGPFAKGTKRFEKITKRELAKGDFVLAIARGSKPMDFLYRSGALPFGFTNPIWVR